MSLRFLDLEHYRLIDSGQGKKLEEISGHRVVRPCPQAIWFPSVSKDEWLKASSICHRKDDGGGVWEHKNKEVNLENIFFEQEILNKTLKLKIKFTNFGHCGVFFEHVQVWKYLIEQAEKNNFKKMKILNLFGYTGGLSCALAFFGHEVDHVDSAKGVLDWGAENQALNGIKKENIRWIHEDAMKFIKNKEREGKIYDGIIADPPSWGHGAKKEKWVYTDQIASFVEHCQQILNKDRGFFFLSGHTHGIQSGCLKNLLFPYRHFKSIEHGDLEVCHQDQKRPLPSGIYVCGHNFK